MGLARGGTSPSCAALGARFFRTRADDLREDTVKRDAGALVFGGVTRGRGNLGGRDLAEKAPFEKRATVTSFGSSTRAAPRDWRTICNLKPAVPRYRRAFYN